MKKYIDLLKSKSYDSKSLLIRNLYIECLKILEIFGLPLNQTPRRLEKTVGAFLALCNVNSIDQLSNPEDINTPRALKTRDIIEWENKFLEEHISSGSYDDIRRKDLKLLILGNIVLKSAPNSATNDSTRGYGVNPVFSEIMKSYGIKNWENIFRSQLKNIPLIKDTLKRKREITKIPVIIPNGSLLEFSNGEHNILQKKLSKIYCLGMDIMQSYYMLETLLINIYMLKEIK